MMCLAVTSQRTRHAAGAMPSMIEMVYEETLSTIVESIHLKPLTLLSDCKLDKPASITLLDLAESYLGQSVLEKMNAGKAHPMAIAVRRLMTKARVSSRRQ